MELHPDSFLNFVQYCTIGCVAALSLGLLLAFAVWVDEKIKWNRGISRRTGKRWKFIKRDKHSGMWVWHDGEFYQAFLFRQH